MLTKAICIHCRKMEKIKINKRDRRDNVNILDTIELYIYKWFKW